MLQAQRGSGWSCIILQPVSHLHILPSCVWYLALAIPLICSCPDSPKHWILGVDRILVVGILSRCPRELPHDDIHAQKSSGIAPRCLIIMAVALV